MGKVFKAFLTNSMFFNLFHFDGLSSEYVIGFGSCLHQDYPQPIWEQVKKQSPNLFIMLGDNVYGDTWLMLKTKSLSEIGISKPKMLSNTKIGIL